MATEALGSGIGMPISASGVIDPTGRGGIDPGLTAVLEPAAPTITSSNQISRFARFDRYLKENLFTKRGIGALVLVAAGVVAVGRNALNSGFNAVAGSEENGGELLRISDVVACPAGILTREDNYAASRPQVLQDPSDAWVAPKTDDQEVIKEEFLRYLFDNAGNTLSPGCDTATYIGALHFIASKRGETNSLEAGSFAAIGNADETIRHFAGNEEAAKKAGEDVAEWQKRALLINKEKYEKVALFRVVGVQNADGSVTINQVPMNVQDIEPGTFAIIGVFHGDAFAEEKDKTSLFVGYDLKTGQLLIGDGFGLPQPQNAGEQTIDVTGGAGDNIANTGGADSDARAPRGGGIKKGDQGCGIPGEEPCGGGKGKKDGNEGDQPTASTPAPTAPPRVPISAAPPTTAPNTPPTTHVVTTTIPPTTTTTQPVVTTTSTTAPKGSTPTSSTTTPCQNATIFNPIPGC
jgi:hypothetical protein